MTIASKLFYLRSSRTSREEDDSQVRDVEAAATGHRRLPQQPLRREPSSHPLRRPSARSSHVLLDRELESFSLDKWDSNDYGARKSSKNVFATNRVCRSHLIKDQYQLDDRLPGHVLEARARLTEKLRSFHLTESRLQTSITRASTNGHQNPAVAIRDSLDLKAEAASKVLESGIMHTTSFLGRDLISSFQNTMRKPSSLSFAVLQRLQEENFIDVEEENEENKVSLECSICLERISNGDRLIRLNCGHRFHHSCLEPWVQAHEVCPYCRASIVS